MANDVHEQLKRALEMRERMFNFISKLEATRKNLEQDLEFYVRMGFPVDIARHYYSEYLRPDLETMEGIESVMRSKHTVFADTMIEKLREVIND